MIKLAEIQKMVDLNALIKLRHILHKFPEVSGEEKHTASEVKSVIANFNPDEIIEGLGGTGIAFVFKGKRAGDRILLRCELDALKIEEINDDIDYASSKKNVSHKCGHDGHMTIMSGLASLLENKIDKGEVVLLFQPAEEIGQGARWVLNDDKFKRIKPDFVYGLHNLPGYPLNSVILRNNTFAAASKGMIIKLFGKTSHAGEPQNGRSPAVALAMMIQTLMRLPQKEDRFNNFTLITIIHALLGEIAFGVNPGYAELRATLRSYENDDMKLLTELATEITKKMAYMENLGVDIGWTEVFPATVNSSDSVELIKKIAEYENLKVVNMESPFKWSEDFGEYLKRYKGAFFGIGSGENHPQLHNPDYDFPDSIISTGVSLFYNILNNHDCIK